MKQFRNLLVESEIPYPYIILPNTKFFEQCKCAYFIFQLWIVGYLLFPMAATYWNLDFFPQYITAQQTISVCQAGR